jgi:formamidopyrimidine-DNA glycosylase
MLPRMCGILHGARVVTVTRRAKVLLIELSSKYSLVIHLKMTGQLVFRGPSEAFGAGHPSNSLVGDLPDKSTRVTFDFDNGAHLYFNDQRKFGWVRLLPTAEVPMIDFMRRVGPEPLADDFSWKDLKERLQRRKNTNIKAALLDQSVIAGVGNIYADESLWGARIHPTTLVRNVSDAKIKALYGSLRDVLQLSIDKGGSTDRNYVDAEGRRGSYLGFANVFRREGKPCNRCGTLIVKTRVAGRGTHVCPKCQKVRH